MKAKFYPQHYLAKNYKSSLMKNPHLQGQAGGPGITTRQSISVYLTPHSVNKHHTLVNNRHQDIDTYPLIHHHNSHLYHKTCKVYFLLFVRSNSYMHIISRLALINIQVPGCNKVVFTFFAKLYGT